MPYTSSGRRSAPAYNRGRSRRYNSRPRTSQPERPRPQDETSELDRALAAAAELPPPAAGRCPGVGRAARLAAARTPREIREPFAIQARALPDALSGRDIL